MDRLLNARDIDTLEKIFATGTCGGDPSAHALMIAKARALLADNALWKAQVASAAAVCDRKEKELADAKLEVERLRAEQDEIHAILGRYEWDSVSLAGGVAALAEAWKGDDLPGQLEAARGDLRVERERADMLEKKLAGQQSNVDEESLKWRTRAQKCQQALRRIRVLAEDMSFALDEDWGADDD